MPFMLAMTELKSTIRSAEAYTVKPAIARSWAARSVSRVSRRRCAASRRSMGLMCRGSDGMTEVDDMVVEAVNAFALIDP